MSGALLVAGTTSDAGKSTVVAGICRWLAREGVRVAPFKAQNMSLNSYVTADGAEIGRAQAMQAQAAGILPEGAMNPVLLKPGSDRHAQVVLRGRPYAETSAAGYAALKPKLLTEALDCLADLRSRFDVVICEGAGSPAEINLRATDIANMGLARAAGLPVVVVGDINPGGVFAALYGTTALLSRADQRLVVGYLINKFRGDPELVRPGLDRITALTGRPVLGLLPWQNGLELDVEDSLALEAPRPMHTSPVGRDVLRISVVRLPRMSNFTDVDALTAEPGVILRFAQTPEELGDADVVILPGTRSTARDLAWLRERDLDAAVLAHAHAGRALLGVCGGYQMLGRQIRDDVECRVGTVPGLALLPAVTLFGPEKVLRRPVGDYAGHRVEGYEIHHGQVVADGGEPFLDGCRVGATYGTTWHGAFENDGFRRAWLVEAAAAAGREFVPGQVSFAAVREARYDVLGDLVATHCDTAALWDLLHSDALPVLPYLPPGAPDVTPMEGSA